MSSTNLKKAFNANKEDFLATSAKKETLAVGIKLVGSANDKDRLTKLVNVLAKSEAGKELLETAKKANFKFSLSDGMEFYGAANPDKKNVILGSKYSDGLLVATLAHELRHVSQYESGVKPEISMYDTKSYLMQNRAMEADAEAYATLVGWELKQKGYSAPYDTYEKNSNHIWKPFEKAVSGEKGVLSDEKRSKALTEAFKGWYEHKALVDVYDGFQADDVQFFLDDLCDYDGGYFEGKLSPEHIVENVCKGKGGKGSYFSQPAKTLESDKLLAISKSVYKRLDRFFDEFLETDFNIVDNSFRKMPVREDGVFKENKEVKKEKKKDIDKNNIALVTVTKNKVR
jgi:hypothetical protein